MSGRTRTSLLMLLTFLLLATSAAQAQVLQRHVAEFRFGAEQLTGITAGPLPVGPDGSTIYLRPFALPITENTVFITLSTTGDAHDGAAHWFSARVNGRLCNPGNEGAGFAPSGWIPLQKHFDYDTTYSGGMSGGDGSGGQGDMHDNGIYYTWCCPRNILLPGAINTAEIKMATSAAGVTVFVERSHYYIDSVNTKLCNQAAAIPVDPNDPVPVDPEPVELLLEANRAKSIDN